MTAAVIGIDLGGTRIKAVLLDAACKIIKQLYAPTNDSETGEWKTAILDCVTSLQAFAGKDLLPVGISAPGLPNTINTSIAFMPGRLQGLENFDWASYLQHPVWVLNDAVSALLAEARVGVAAGKKNVVMLTLGTGVGGAILINGQPYQGTFNKAGHIGHMVLDDDGEPDITGMPGSLEDAIGNATIHKRSGGRFQSTHDLLEACRSGDVNAKEVWLTSVRKLAIGLASVTNILSPEIIVLGGGITEAGDDLFHPLEEYMGLYEWRAGGNGVKIIKAHHGDMAGAMGAACYALEKITD